MHAMPIFSSTARRSTTLKLDEYYEIIDLVKQQIDSRFANPVLGTLAALQEGHMTTTLREFCSLHHRDPETVERQLQFTSMALKANKPDNYRFNLNDLFRFTSIQPELHYIVDVALTLPVTSASAERAFSRLRLVKNHLRTTMLSERLQSLLRISANSITSNGIALDRMIEQFAKSERKIII
jgi:Trp operon repressor